MFNQSAKHLGVYYSIKMVIYRQNEAVYYLEDEFKL